jgi:hypothetical protein
MLKQCLFEYLNTILPGVYPLSHLFPKAHQCLWEKNQVVFMLHAAWCNKGLIIVVNYQKTLVTIRISQRYLFAFNASSFLIERPTSNRKHVQGHKSVDLYPIFAAR